jgi:hypothetical protein
MPSFSQKKESFPSSSNTFLQHKEHFVSKKYPSVPVVGQVIPLNAGDVERALTYWADNANIKLVGVPLGIRDSYTGKEQVRIWIQCLITQHSQIQIKVIKVQDNIVTTRTETRNDLTRHLGISALISTETYHVIEGKLACLTLTISPKSHFMFRFKERSNL